MEEAPQVQPDGLPAALVAFLVGEAALAHGHRPRQGRCIAQPPARLVVGAGDAQRLAPAPHDALADAPPALCGVVTYGVPNGRSLPLCRSLFVVPALNVT
jgi:hypothetical protein